MTSSRLAALVTIALLAAPALAGCARPAGTAPGVAERPGAEPAVAAAVNGHRQARGLGRLELDPRISAIARRHSVSMASRRALDHDGFEARGGEVGELVRFSRVAENVAHLRQRCRGSAAAALGRWLESRRHRKNLEGPFDLTGVGAAETGDGDCYLTQIFVARQLAGPRSRASHTRAPSTAGATSHGRLNAR